MSLEPQIDDIRASLQKHAKAIDGLLRLVPPKFYIPEIHEETLNLRYMKNTKHDTDAKKKDAQRKARAQAKAARLDPDNHKTVQELQAEKLERQEAEKQEEQQKAKRAKTSTKEDEGTKMAKISVDLSDTAAKQTEEENKEEPAKMQPMSAAGSITELRTRLHERIELLRAKRKAPEDDRSREALLEKRMKRRKKTQEAKAKAKKAGKVAQEQVLGSKTPGGSGTAGKAANGGADEVKDSIYYGTLTTGAAKKKKSINAKQQLTKVENKKKEMKELKKVDAAKAAKLEDKSKWGKALDLAKGEKVKDDPKLLRKTVRREEQQKKKSSREWNERKNTLESKMKERVEKRDANIKARVEAKKMKKQGKSKKAIERTLKASKGAMKKGAPKKGAPKKGPASKARPGFEGKSAKGSKK
ncbi:SURF6-domain-containing protein [Martensiomyces pterosporus]|nr:SURF6-domain-containing protein [Martensiomyces pterosporus]